MDQGRRIRFHAMKREREPMDRDAFTTLVSLGKITLWGFALGIVWFILAFFVRLG